MPSRPSGRVCALVLLILAAAVGAAALVAWQRYRELERTVVAKLTGRPWALPARVYADAFPLYPGMQLAGTGFFERLRRLGYRHVEGPVRQRGQVWQDPRGGFVDVFLHAFGYPLHPEAGRVIRIELGRGVIGRVRDLETGDDVGDAALEPEPLAGLYDQAWEERRVVPLAEVPPQLVRAVLAIEDSRFLEHGPVDWRGVARALVRNLSAGRIVEGGSTLTQQLMKNFFLTEARTFRRKATEVAMAFIAERHYTKEQILEHYLNEIYLGQSGAKGVFGVAEAAQFYFGKELADLTIGESALLAGLIRAPNRYSPFRSSERARARRDTVLAAMVAHGAIGAAEATVASAEPIVVRDFVPDRTNAPYFVDLVRRELAATYRPEALTAQGLGIFTTLDAEMQAAAEDAVREGLAALEQRHPRLVRADPGERLEAALVALHPATGEIKAMVGGRDYRVTQFNRVTDAQRQPGSIFKPVVYYAALDPGDGPPHLVPTTRLVDEPFAWAYDGRSWTPRNYRDRYLGEVTLRRALELSLNAATARAAHEIGLARVVTAAGRLGFAAPLPALPAIVLGSVEATPLNVAEIYAVLASQGQRTSPRAVKQVASEAEVLLEGRPVVITSVVSPQVSYLVTHLLEGAVDHGTAAGVRESGFALPAAGKTGTTNDYGDAWFAGYTPDLVAVVWVGFDRRQPLGLSGAQAALPIWTAFMRRATAGRAVQEFEPPPGVQLVAIDPQSGGRASAGCPATLVEAFLDEDVPREECPVHGARPAAPVAPAEATPAPAQREEPWWRRLLGIGR